MRSGEITRIWADWPTAVLSMSASVGPSQSSELSPEAFRNGRIARDNSGVFALPVPAVEDPERTSPVLRTHPPASITKTREAMPIHFQGRAGLAGVTGTAAMDASVGRAPW